MYVIEFFCPIQKERLLYLQLFRKFQLKKSFFRKIYRVVEWFTRRFYVKSKKKKRREIRGCIDNKYGMIIETELFQDGPYPVL